MFKKECETITKLLSLLYFLDNTFWVDLPNPQTLNAENLLCLDLINTKCGKQFKFENVQERSFYIKLSLI